MVGEEGHLPEAAGDEQLRDLELGFEVLPNLIEVDDILPGVADVEVGLPAQLEHQERAGNLPI